MSCTYRHGGYLFGNRPTFIAPSSGRITAIRVRSGPNPARLRLTVLTGSSRVDPFTGRDQPGTYTCCTARFLGRAFRPRANRTTTKKVNVRVFDVRSKRLRYPDPLLRRPRPDRRRPGHAAAAGPPGRRWLRRRHPDRDRLLAAPAKGDPRVDGYSMTGIDLMFQWNFRRR